MCIFHICRSPEPVIENEEDEPEYDKTLVVLDWYNSDLNLIINKTDFVSGAPLTEAVFAYMYAGARATYGFENGKVCYEVKVQIILFEKFDYRCTTICLLFPGYGKFGNFESRRIHAQSPHNPCWMVG